MTRSPPGWTLPLRLVVAVNALAVAGPLVDLAPRPGLRGQGRSGPGPVRPHLGGEALGEDDSARGVFWVADNGSSRLRRVRAASVMARTRTRHAPS